MKRPNLALSMCFFAFLAVPQAFALKLAEVSFESAIKGVKRAVESPSSRLANSVHRAQVLKSAELTLKMYTSAGKKNLDEMVGLMAPAEKAALEKIFSDGQIADDEAAQVLNILSKHAQEVEFKQDLKATNVPASCLGVEGPYSSIVINFPLEGEAGAAAMQVPTGARALKNWAKTKIASNVSTDAVRKMAIMKNLKGKADVALADAIIALKTVKGEFNPLTISSNTGKAIEMDLSSLILVDMPDDLKLEAAKVFKEIATSNATMEERKNALKKWMKGMSEGNSTLEASYKQTEQMRCFGIF